MKDNKLAGLSFIIVGAGPVGCSLALFLITQGAKVTLFEKESSVIKEARANAIQPKILDCFMGYEIIDVILSRGIKIDTVQYWDGDNFDLLARFEFKEIAQFTHHPYRLHLPQYKLSEIILEHLKSYNNFTIHYNHPVVDTSEHPNGVEVTVLAKDKEITQQADMLLAADGGKSTVRSAVLKIPLEGRSYSESMLELDTDYDLSRRFNNLCGADYIIGEKMSGVFLRVEQGVERANFALKNNEDPDQELQLDRATARMQGLLKTDETIKILRRRVYTVHQRIAQTFGQNRICLFGDAAHLNSPVGGLGLNTGVLDSWFFIQVLIKNADKGLDWVANEYRNKRYEWVKKNTLAISDARHNDVMKKKSAQDSNVSKNKYREMASDKDSRVRFLLESSLLLNQLNP